MRVEPVPAYPAPQPDRAEPFVLRGGCADWPCARWTIDVVGARLGDAPLAFAEDFGPIESPYLARAADFVRTGSFGEVASRIEAGERLYLAQASILHVPELMDELPFSRLVAEPIDTCNLWFGRATKSGLHYDDRDNLFLMLRGRKRVFLAAPKETRHLHPFPGLFHKSPVDPEAPRYDRYPRLRRASFREVELGPGDVLFIPKSWWHHLSSTDISMSVNGWFGPTRTLRDDWRTMVASGPRAIARTAADFINLGIRGKPYDVRLFASEPAGLTAHARLREFLLRAREKRAPRAAKH